MSGTSRNMILLLTLALGLGGLAFASSKATIEVKGAEQPGDVSSITIAFSDSAGRAYNQTINYGPYSTTASIAATIGASFSNAYAPRGYLSAQVLCGTTTIVQFTLKSPATFGNLTVTGSNSSFQLNSSGFASSGSRTAPTITWPTPAAITSGTALSATQLNATANVAGTFTYFPGPGAVLGVGASVLSATFTPTDITDYAPVTATVTLTVSADQAGQNTPVISWPTPGAILYGTALSSAQLNASASYNGTSVPGVFEYTPSAGEVLPAGAQALLVLFFPTDSVHYTTGGGSTSLQVNPNSSENPLTIYSYSIAAAGGGSGYASNGNIQSVNDSVTGTWSFSYDTLNRLVSGNPTSGNRLCWSYDSFGNRTAQVSQSAACPTLPSVPMANASYSPKNQVTSTSHNPVFTYDAGTPTDGYITNDTINTYIYDGEGRICAVMNEAVPSMPTMTQYIYDAEGVRVAKGAITNWSAGCDTTKNGFTATNAYVFGLSKEQLTETDGNGNWMHTNVYGAGMLLATYDTAPTGDPALHFQIEDWLGTRRVQTDISGNPEETFTSQPFGDGFNATEASGAPPTADDATEHHFTHHERDTESQNDYFGARYYGSNMGRFLSPDPSQLSYADPRNPQSLNLYSYALNSPLSYIDPSGLVPCGGQAQITIIVTPDGSAVTQSPDDCPDYVSLQFGNEELASAALGAQAAAQNPAAKPVQSAPSNKKWH